MRSAALSWAWMMGLAVLGAIVLPACGAFADVANDGPEDEPTLILDPRVVEQGKKSEHTITFGKDPPWVADTRIKCQGPAFIGTFEIEGTGIDRTYSYEGGKTIKASLQTDLDAPINTRKVVIEAVCQRSGSGQLKHREWNLLWVFTPQDAEPSAASADGGDGSDGGTE